MKKIGIIGAGNMGAGIAQKTAQEGLDVVMVDLKPEFVDRGLNSIRETLEQGVERRIFRPEQVEDILSRIHGTPDLEAVRDCDLVIEAVFEDEQVKKDLFARLDDICDPKTILATNTSSFSVDQIGEGTKRTDRFIGLHFFFHPAKNRLLEIIPGSHTSPETVNACRRFSQLTGKTDILVKDETGFAVNRFFVPWLNESIRIFEEGWADCATIDQANMDTLGIGMGPFLLMNVTGIPIAYHSMINFQNNLGPFYAPSPKLKELFESGELWPLEGEVDQGVLEKVSDRILGAVFYVAATLVEEGVADMTDTDVGAKVGLRWRKGPFELMNQVGMDKSRALVENLLKAWPDLSVPASLLAQQGTGAPWDIRYVKYVRDGKLGRVILSRPDALNALNHTVVKQLDETFARAEADPDTEAVILEGAGKAFVAGADIKFFIDCIKEDRLEDNVKFTAFGQEVLNRIDDAEKLVIAKLDGLALGGGLELALAADVIAATPKAVMGFPETGIGIYPGLGGTQRTARFIGKELAKYLIFTGRIISAKDAEAIGLVDYVFMPDEIDERLRALVSEKKLTPNKGGRDLPPDWQKLRESFLDEKIEGWLARDYLDHEDPLLAKTAKMVAGKAPVALSLANRIVDAGYEKPLKEGVKEELAHLKEIFATKDALTGLTNVGRRDITFEGR